jgi:protein-ribulosamine 3-kinase
MGCCTLLKIHRIFLRLASEMIPAEVVEWLTENQFGRVVESQPVSGGCINHCACVQTSSGVSFFLKTNQSTPAEMFVREAEGLNALRIGGGPYVPEAFICGPDFLLMEDLNPGSRQLDYWTAFGHRLARLHNLTHSDFGFSHDNYIGSTPQPNPRMANGYLFFGEQRLLFQARLASNQGLLELGAVRRVEQLIHRLPDLIPDQPASLIHGDLWGGNAMTNAAGEPAIIDPAVHYGWAEAELAMTTLFGAFPEAFYIAYQEVRPLEKHFQQRFPIYNLYHLLNHLNLFGSGYLGQVLSILRQFS